MQPLSGTNETGNRLDANLDGDVPESAHAAVAKSVSRALKACKIATGKLEH